MGWLTKLASEEAFDDLNRRILRLEVDMEMMKRTINVEQVVIDKKGSSAIESSNVSNVEGC